MSSVSQVGPGLFLSGLEPALKTSVLTRRNIKLIVNASGISLQYPPVPDLEVLEVPVQDRPHAPLHHFFEPVSERIQQSLERDHGVLVHCTAGRSRSAALILAFLLRWSGRSLAESHRLLLDCRPFVRINAGFWRRLMDLELQVQGRCSVQMVQTEAGVLPHGRAPGEGGEGYCING